MSELMDGWERVALGDVVDVVTDYWDRNPDNPERFIAGEHIDEGDLFIRRWGTTSDDLVPPTFNRRFRTGDVLFHSRNLKKLAQTDFGGITGEKIFVLRSRNTKRLLNELLPFILQTQAFSEYANRMWAGSTNKFLNKSPLISYKFALPPLLEQKQIFLRLSAFEVLRAELDNAIRCAKAVRDRLQITMCQGASRWRNLDSGLELITSGSRGWSRHYSERGDIFLRVGNLNSPTIDLNLADIQYVNAPRDAEAERTRVQPEDVLLGITGEAGIGLVGLVRKIAGTTFISQHIALIRVNKDIFSPEFVAHVLAGSIGQRQIKRFNQPGAKAGMTLISVRNLEVPDYPLKIQQLWGEQISEVERTMLHLTAQKRKIAEMARMAMFELLQPETHDAV